ncbi:ATP-dependent RNA helicase DHX33-like [Gigantopelta aegis]|uniref:ATP-dependent RNA helicase DHX33-like n=1 Tax=Gigantopelta aegis TaxID=1735272 RepID=UPI001B88816C|nr:ATP-dependent RNA helicase DHX33-like [Gigantopelta aegis]
MAEEEPKKKRARLNTNGQSTKSNWNEQYEKLRQERTQLPIYPSKQTLIEEVEKVDTAIVIGETGSGKTTQIPQYLLETRLNRGAIIAVTQPRRVAAITIAQRVAQEKRSELGGLVGYCVRFEDVTSETTKIKYMTDGMLLREAILDPILKRYSVVILDEAHERTIHTDVLFGVVKAAQRKRKTSGMKPLKILVMSATMDVNHFSDYFNNAPILYLEGRQYPVELLYACEPQSDYLYASLVTLFKIHKQEPPGKDVLIFLTGQEEIESAVLSIRDLARDTHNDLPPMVVCPLYAALPSYLQLRVFEPTPKGSRKVIVSTNIAETSITIPGIRFVIDSGVVKAKVFNPGSGLDLLKVVRVSRAQATQRMGRAGREAPGACYCLYTEEEHDAFRANTLPEILRCNLSSIVLQLLALGITDIVNFDFMDKPSVESIVNALDQLHRLGAVEKTDKIKLTPTGKKMAAFPLDPRLSKTILVSKDFHCSEEILSIVSMLSVESVFFTPQNKRDAALAARKKFVSSEGDTVTLLNIYKAYKSARGDKHWCFENYINRRNMKMALQVRKQLREITQKQNLPLKSCGVDTTAIRDLTVIDPDWLYEAAPTYFKKRKPAAIT